MSFIRVQAVKRNDDGIITHGSASIVASRYDPTVKGGHCRQEVVEHLGRVLWLGPGNKEGVFVSPTRGVVRYDCRNNEFSEVDPGSLSDIDRTMILPPPQSHTHFGDVFLLMSFMRENGLLDVFQTVFPQRPGYERFVVHLAFELLREGSHEKCDTFFRQSALSHACASIVPYTLRSDTAFFETMGGPDVKRSMFAAVTAWMRSSDPEYGKACYVDSSPLPNDSKGNPYNALRCQPGTGCEIEDRLALVLDQSSGVPVWYEIFPGNRTDVDTLNGIMKSVYANLGVEVTGLVLDSGYVSGDLLECSNADRARTVIARMPGRKGYPRQQLFEEVLPFINDGKHALERNGHVYFGMKLKKVIQNQPIFTYVMIDRINADLGLAKYMRDHAEEFGRMTPEERSWRLVDSGFFVLLSNIDSTPDEILAEYLDRASVEAIFKDSKTFLRLLPMAKWTEVTVRGKILLDIVAELVRTRLLRALPKYRGALSDLFAEAQIVDCFGVSGRTMLIDSGNRQAKGAFKLFGKTVPGHITKGDWERLIYGP